MTKLIKILTFVRLMVINVRIEQGYPAQIPGLTRPRLTQSLVILSNIENVRIIATYPL